jgi:hypothetical protein
MQALHEVTHQHAAAAAAAAAPAAAPAVGGRNQWHLLPAVMMRHLMASCSGASRIGLQAFRGAAVGAGAEQ